MATQNVVRVAERPSYSPSVLQEIAGLKAFLLNVPFHLPEGLYWISNNIFEYGRKLLGTTFNPDRDIQDQSGKVILITGGTLIVHVHVHVHVYPISGWDLRL